MLFNEIIGLNSLKNKLIETVDNGRISHTLLFNGKDGSENLSLSIAYAQYISCTNKQRFEIESDLLADSCGECPSCKKFSHLAHPDLHFIFPVATTKEVTTKPTSSQFAARWRQFVLDKNGYVSENEWYNYIGIENKQGRIGVDDANEINQMASVTPYESNFNFIIIWLAEKLYHAAAPKLLKILEEPPENTVFFMISQDTDQILKTILSRAQLIKIPRHSDEEIRYWLKNYFNISTNKIDHAVNLAEGNMKKVFSLLEEDQTGEQMLIDFRELMLLCYGNQFLQIKEKVAKLSTFGREKLKQFLSYGIRIIRLSVINDLSIDKLFRATNNEKDFVIKFSKFVNKSNAEEFIAIISLAIKHIERNGNARIVLMDMSLQIVVLFMKSKIKKGS